MVRLENRINESYELAKEAHAQIGVDADAAIGKLEDIDIVLHHWQGDDVSEFEKIGAKLSGSGIQTIRPIR